MKRFRNSIITAIGFVALITVGTISSPRSGYGSPGVSPGAPAVQTQNVNVVNTPGVIAQQAGVWSVGISGTPTVALDGSNNTVKLDPDGNVVRIDSATPVSVRDADNPARRPFAASCVINNPQGFPCFLTVPQGRLLVIEMYQGGGDLNVVTNNTPVMYHFNQLSQLVRIYADPGSTIAGGGAAQGTNIVVSGYLIDP